MSRCLVLLPLLFTAIAAKSECTYEVGELESPRYCVEQLGFTCERGG